MKSEKLAASEAAYSCCSDGPGLERDESRHVIGADPRTMTPAQLREIGHEPMAPLKVIRARCLDCCAGSASEVRNCTATKCPSWPMRMGVSPWRKPLSADEKKRRGEHARKMRATKTNHDISKNDNANPKVGGRKAGSAKERKME
jgi:hypothetical protein